MEILAEKIIEKYSEQLREKMHKIIMLETMVDELKEQNEGLNQLINDLKKESKLDLGAEEKAKRMSEIQEIESKRNEEVIDANEKVMEVEELEG